ncbi:MAG: hypothetical protein C1943_15245 [Halochromatium sp.]|nr:hypothetical protein [Halochromatium sp.]
MARIIPSDISALALAGAHSGELETLALLKADLGSAYSVFHSVHWSSSQSSRGLRVGEIDFIIVNQAGHVLCIEQKNGALVETPEGLVKVYGQRQKSVNSQIQRSLDQVRDKFRWQQRRAPPLILDYLLYCPDYRVQRLNAVGLDQNRIVDAAASDGLARRIERVLGPGNPDHERRTLIEDFFCHTFDVLPQIRVYLDAQQQHYVRHGSDLAELISTIEMTPYRVRVSGTAGCGKSLLATAFAREQTAQQRRVLMICFNRPLADRLQRLLPDVDANTFYGFCDQFLRARGEVLDYQRMNQPGFWGEVQDRVLAAPIPDDWRFDVLIVDEGQDFDADWFDIMQLFLREDGRMLWLDDPDQNLLNKPQLTLPGFISLRARKNFRSPYSIARFMRDQLDIDFEPANPLPGLGVGVHRYKQASDQIKILEGVLRDLIKQGFASEEIVILSLRGVGKSDLWKQDIIGKHRIRRFTGGYQPDGTQIWTDGLITLDSLYRFKGQEAPAVILTDIEDQKDQERLNRLLYCGMSRATVRLELIGDKRARIYRRLTV